MTTVEREEWSAAARAAAGDGGVKSGTDAFVAQARALGGG